MPRIVGIDIPNQKAIWIALTYVYGIGRHTAKDIFREAKVDVEYTVRQTDRRRTEPNNTDYRAQLRRWRTASQAGNSEYRTFA